MLQVALVGFAQASAVGWQISMMTSGKKSTIAADTNSMQRLGNPGNYKLCGRKSAL